ncbi:MDIS1-interacting receptor like kinase 2-like protein [Tanacetum coccineum]
MAFPSTFFLLATILCTLCVASCSSQEADALINWKATLHTQNNIRILPSWTQEDQKAVSPCNWHGVSCNEQGSINKLNLSSSGLNGTLDHFSFSSFPNLGYLSLGSNNFSGIIPSEIGQLSKLVYLDLSTNLFMETIPPEIGELTNLDTLKLAKNQLVGLIPKSLCQLRFLFELALNDNNLYGSVPSCFGQLSRLIALYGKELINWIYPKNFCQSEEANNLVSIA